MSHYWFIQREKAAFPLVTWCRLFRACSGVLARARSDEALTAPIATAHEWSRRTSSAPRVHAKLRAGGIRCARTHVARLLRASGLVGCHRRRARTTIADPAHTPAPNLVARDFAATAPDRHWIGDSTCVPTREGWRSRAVLLDVHSRRVVGWAMADHLRAARAARARGWSTTPIAAASTRRRRTRLPSPRGGSPAR